MDSFTNALAAFTRLLPHSVSDQASKMFVKRLLKAFFDRVEELIYRILWAALSGLFQTFWLLVFQRVVRRVTTPAASSASSVASSSSGSVSAMRSWSPVTEDREMMPTFALSPAADDDAAGLDGSGGGVKVEGEADEQIEGREGCVEGNSMKMDASESSERAEHINEQISQARALAEKRIRGWVAANRDSRKGVDENPVREGIDGTARSENSDDEARETEPSRTKRLTSSSSVIRAPTTSLTRLARCCPVCWPQAN